MSQSLGFICEFNAKCVFYYFYFVSFVFISPLFHKFNKLIKIVFCFSPSFQLFKFSNIIDLFDLVHFQVICCLKGLLIKLMLILGQVMVSKGRLCPAGLESPAGAISKRNHIPNLFQINLDPAFYREVHLIQIFQSREIRFK